MKATMRGYRLLDYLTQGYVALVAAVILLFHGGRLPLWPAYLAAHLLVIAATHVLIIVGSRQQKGFLHLLRCFYPVILYGLLYTETHELDSVIRPGYLDPFFVRLEQAIFGCQPSRELMRRLPYLVVSEVLHFAYFSYYLMVFGVGLYLYLTDKRHLFRYLTIISFLFYVCYLTYMFLPVMGPHGSWVSAGSAEARELLGDRQIPPAIARGPFFTVMQQVYRLVEPEGGAAFPSSHVAVALATVYFTFQYWRRIRWVHLADVVLLCISTVYCGYHYAVDVIAGIATMAVLVPLGNLLYRVAGEAELDDAPCEAE